METNLLTKRLGALSIAMLSLFACQNKKDIHSRKMLPTERAKTAESKPVIHTDTLQFIHFENNFDYWYGIFLNSKMDTISLVTDSVIAAEYKNTLLEVKWYRDTLHEAGDNESKYTAERMSAFRPIKGKPFVTPITEAQILRDVRNLPEVQSGADQVVIAERPSEAKNYYLVETGTRGEDNYSRFMMFRVYTYPSYRIRVYDLSGDVELELEEWRKRND